MTAFNLLNQSLADAVLEEENTCFCRDCDEAIESDSMEIDGELLCEDCVCNYAVCYECNVLNPANRNRTVEYTRYDGITASREYCLTCLHRYCTRCSDCCEYHPDDIDSYFMEDSCERICPSCYVDGAYFLCQSCSYYFTDESYSSEGRCVRCAEDEDNSDEDTRDPDDWCEGVHSYGANVLGYLQMLGTPKDGIYFGVELETQSPNDREQFQLNADDCNEALEDFAILKADCSIGSGFEIVSAPATLEIHRNCWESFLGNVPDSMYVSGTCGLHVHVSRKPLSQLTIGKILVLVNSEENKNFITAIAGRISDNYARLDKGKKISDVRKENYSRYQSVNLTNNETIEFRIFAATLDAEEFMARLEFVHACVYYCQVASMRKLGYEELMVWVHSNPSNYPNLIEWWQNSDF